MPDTLINGWLIRFFTLNDPIFFQSDAAMPEINVPITSFNLETGEEKKLKLVGGCKGISVEDKFIYRPHYSYAIVENVEQKLKE